MHLSSCSVQILSDSDLEYKRSVSTQIQFLVRALHQNVHVQSDIWVSTQIQISGENSEY